MKRKFVLSLLFGVAMSLISVMVWWLFSILFNTFLGPAPTIVLLTMLGISLAAYKVTERIGINPIVIGELVFFPAFLVPATFTGVLAASFQPDTSSSSALAVRFYALVLVSILLSIFLSIAIRRWLWRNRLFSIASTAALAWLCTMGVLKLLN